MSEYLWFFAPAAVMVAALSYGSWKRLAVGVLTLGLIYAGTVDLLSRPKPARIELLATLDRSQVIWHAGVPDVAIWALLAIDHEPRLYSLPWSEATNRALHEAEQRAEQQGGMVRLARPRDGAPGGEWGAEFVPPEPPPAKR